MIGDEWKKNSVHTIINVRHTFEIRGTMIENVEKSPFLSPLRIFKNILLPQSEMDKNYPQLAAEI